MDLNAKARPGEQATKSARESRVGVAVFVISLALVLTFPIIVFLPIMTEHHVGLPDGNMRLGDFLVLLCWLPLLGMNCLLTLGTLWTTKQKKRFAMAAIVVNAGLVLLIVWAFAAVRIH